MRDEELRRRVQYAAHLHGESPAEVVAEVEDDQAWQEDDGAGKTRGWPHYIARYTSLVAVGVVLGFMIIGTMKFVNDPVAAKGTSLGVATAAPAPGAAHSSVLQGLNFQFSYPGMFDQVAQVKSGANMIEQYMLSSKSTTSHQVAVALEDFKSSSYTEDSGWQLRQERKTEYTPGPESNGADKIGMMTKNDKTEQTMYWLHNGKLLTVSVTTSDPKDDVTAIMTVIKGSMQWRK